MTDSELHPYVEWIAREARRPVVTDSAARDRIMAAVRAEPVPQRRSAIWGRLVSPRVFSLSPVAGTLLAAGLVGIGVFAGGLVHNRDGQSVAGRPVAAVAPQLPVSDTVVRFVYVAPQASKVFVAGDFNGWDTTKTPLVRTSSPGVWSVTLPLSAGRHIYAFVVDGSWTVDPSAPLAPDDGFGHANSVKLVRGGSSL
jgi:Glycogen recognition site of AMP-activated protein kinase